MDNYLKQFGSKEIASAAIKIALTSDRRDEKLLQQEFAKLEILSAAVDYGGEFITSVKLLKELLFLQREKE